MIGKRPACRCQRFSKGTTRQRYGNYFAIFSSFRYGIDIIGHYSSGNQIPLIPVLLDIGVNLYAPLEVAAGMDAQALRNRFGKDILLLGNISRQALMDGPQAVEQEFYAKVPPMMASGGYIPAVDDMILPDISFESYKRYIDMVWAFRL